MDEFQVLDQLYSDHFPFRNIENRPTSSRPDDLTTGAVLHTTSMTDGDDRDDGDNEIEYIVEIPDMPEYDDQQNSESDEDETSFPSTDTLTRVASGCGCVQNCVNNIDKSLIQTHVDNLREMTKDEKELYVMGALQKINPDSKRSRYGDRKRTRYEYKYEGNSICKNAFLIIYDVRNFTLKSLIKHMAVNGNVPRVHGNSRRKPHHALSFGDVERVVKFIAAYSVENGLPQPAAPRGRDNIPPVFLPAWMTKKGIHAIYAQGCQETDARTVKIRSFVGIWSQCIAHIKIATPEDDVCAKCEIIRMRVGDSRTDDEKLAAATELQEHILAARREHMVYKTCVATSKEELKNLISDQHLPVEPCTTDLQQCHYTFDFAQNVAVPHHSRQIGPMYFLTARKIHIFGIRDDGLSRQYNYLIDEAQTIEEDGKGIHGPNAVISMLDHGLTAHSHGEQRMMLHADNCAGQNKNRYVLAYLSWRTMVGLNREVVYLMQLPGHARCLVDAGFAHIKRLYRRSDCETLRDIERVVNLSAYSNVAVLYQGDGNQHTWDWRDWKTFLSQYFRALKGIRAYQQFRFSTLSPGVVFVKEHDDSEETPITIFSGGDVPTTRPPTIPAAGLSATRQQYLATNVRKYLHDANKEVTCPLPEE